MRYYDEVYSGIVPFKFIKYIVFMEGGLGIVFLILYIMHLTDNLGIEDELPAIFFLIMALIMLVVAAFLTTLTKLRVGVTPDLLRALFSFIKFEVPLSSVSNVYTDEKAA